MTDMPPEDPADHAGDFALRWADRLDEYCGVRMEVLGIPTGRIGSSDHAHGIAWCAFNPHEREGGGVSPAGQVTVDAGVLDEGLMDDVGPPAAQAWRRARLRDRVDAIVAHEDTEWRTGSHEGAVEHAPETELPIGGRPRGLLRAIRLGEQATRRGGPSPRR